MKRAHFAIPILLAIVLASCTAPTTRTVYVSEDPQAAYRASHGSITKIEQVEVSGGTSGAGAVIGGIVGGVAGHQVGQGRGKDVATIAGAVGGVLIGNEVEKRNTAPKTFYRVSVRLDNGGSRTFEQGSLSNLEVGDRIRIDRNQLVRG